MNAENLDTIDLVCPKCRHMTKGGMKISLLEIGKVLKEDKDHILEGFLVCKNPDCDAVYPITEGVPVVLRNMAQLSDPKKVKPGKTRKYIEEVKKNLKGRKAEISGNSPDTEVNTLACFADSHYGEFTNLQKTSPFKKETKKFWKTIKDLSRPPTRRRHNLSLDAGCSTGRFTFELAKTSKLAVGIDLRFNALAEAVKFQRTGEVNYKRRTGGAKFENVTSEFVPKDNVLFLLADALDPPFRPESFEFAASLNLLDNVAYPLILLGQLNALLKTEGILLTASPYEWTENICDPAEWLVSDELESAEMVTAVLEGEMFSNAGLDFEIEETVQGLPWPLRNHDRYWSLFLVHVIRAKKLS